ncbi:hypothetical protein [Rhodococcoides corynebacterioides]|uniref:hypothetical protein n=1 Tax=Rhodococcoides corynebacterioides TaxID=53972 RepID=UPI001C9B788B|nr:hypothetical protein [Rhodococcus corynebacterioides]MBY6352070.1 hypothetical protein [Rhodococcus corynebacterioides]
MWLIDDAGRAVEPSYPRGYCGLDNTLGLFEIQSLPEVGAVEHRLRLDPAGPCAERATTTAATVLTGIDNEYAVIELDGCKRVLANGYIPLSAPTVLLDAIRVVQP